MMSPSASIFRFAAAAALAATLSARAGTFAFGPCRATWDDASLTIANDLFSRTWRVRGAQLQTVSWRAADGTEWTATNAAALPASGRLVVSCAAEAPNSVGATGLVVRVKHADGGETVLRTWADVPGTLELRAPVLPLPPHPAATNFALSVYQRTCAVGHSLPKRAAQVADVLSFAPASLRVVARTLVDQTDVRAELLREREWLAPTCELPTEITTSALDVRDLATDAGVTFLRLAPMPTSRPVPIPDFVFTFRRKELAPLANGYPLAALVYAGGEAGRVAALRKIQRALRLYRPGRDGLFLSNTWGDGNRDSRINADFLMKEIEAGADVGVDVVQIDDGWQRGRSANTTKKGGGKRVWNGYWAVDPNYWEPDAERFPQGVKPLADAARARGMHFGLWFGPDSSGDAANWERDADKLLDYWRTCGIAYFKIDSLKLHTPLALERNARFFDKALRESHGDMVFDLDCTAEERPGYLGSLHVGPVFVENRYADRGGRYFPHLALRTVWTLAQVVDPVRLRIEVLNPAKKADRYAADDPFAPAKWPADALFAIAMTASPLGWMEVSDVPPAVRAAWKPLVATWKRERARWHGGTIFPVGAKPDGFVWTGFVSRAGDGGGYALLFRERAAAPDFALDLRPYFAAAPDRAETIGGRGAARVEGGVLRVRVDAPLDWIWVKLEPLATDKKQS